MNEGTIQTPPAPDAGQAAPPAADPAAAVRKFLEQLAEANAAILRWQAVRKGMLARVEELGLKVKYQTFDLEATRRELETVKRERDALAAALADLRRETGN